MKDKTVKNHKYHIVDKDLRTDKTGQVFDSKAEMERYHELLLIQKQGFIKDLRRQVHFELQEEFIHKQHGNIRKIDYIADFTYLDNGFRPHCAGRHIVEDVKGAKLMTTSEYKLKRKLFLHNYGGYLFFEVYRS